MAQITGIGGIFFRAKDPAALADWYERVLGVNKVPQDYDTPSWQQKAGPTVFAPFEDTTDYFGRPEQGWMINFRVDDLNGMIEDLKGHGVAVEVDTEIYPNGRFARLSDPEGNPIQLWEPAGNV